MTDIAVKQPPVGDALVERAAAGDEIAFARLIAEHNAAMARVAYVIIGDREATLDAVQSAWTIAWRRLGSLRDVAQVRSWLIAIAANEARQHRRRERRASVVDISHAMDKTGAADPADDINVVDLERALRSLGADDRRLLALRFAGGLDSNEISQYLGLSASGVRSRLSRLIDRLRVELDTDEGNSR